VSGGGAYARVTWRSFGLRIRRGRHRGAVAARTFGGFTPELFAAVGAVALAR
jgi:hypothetical protein